MDCAISTTELTKTYGAKTAVRALDLTVPTGSVFGFLGANGAGKTTTIRMLLGLVRPTSGSATVLGLDVARARRRIAPQVGAIVETPTFYPYLGGVANLRAMALGAGYALSTREAGSLMERVGLDPGNTGQVKGYSLGMKQRLGLASALAGDPSVLFLDEPTNGLDPEGAREIRELLASLARSGRTIFLSSHLLLDVERICTDVAILERGALRVQGKVADLLESTGFELRVSSVAQAVASGPVTPRDEADAGPGWVLATVDEAQIPGLLRALLLAGVDVFEVRARRGSLEDLFFGADGARQAAA